jgi:hypothetical protein
LTSGDGYAVVWGNPVDSTSPEGLKKLRLVRYSGGLDADANLSELVGGPNLLNQNNGGYLDLKVTLNPSTREWQLFSEARDDGYGNPDLATLRGSVTDSTYTGQPLNHTGFFMNSDHNNVGNLVANVALTVIPEPAVGAVFIGLGLTGFCLIRRVMAR